MHTNDIRHLALIEEVRCAIYLIQEGLLSLNRLDGANDFAHLPIFLFSNGFERLLKMVICLDYLERAGKFPDTPDFRREIKTHNITKLLSSIIEISKNWGYTERCLAAKQDMNFLETDQDLQALVKLLSEYGEASRYYNINLIIGEKNKREDPIRIFESYCTDVFTRQPDWQQKITCPNPGEKIDANIRYVNKQIIVLLQKFARALCRMFTIGKLGQTGKQLSGIIGVFLFIKDEELGRIQT
jgi:hypothetical protein